MKSRTEYDRTDLLTEPGRRFVAECLATSGACPQARADEVADTLMPALSTTYERTTLHLPADGARVTIDTTLTWSHPSAATGEAGETYQACGYAVVETKNPATPSPADRLLWAAGYRPTRVSKYATGMALLHPGLPANTWHRVMHRELAGGEHRELAQAGARPPTSVPAVGLLELVGARRRAEAPGRPPGALTRPRFSRGHSTCMRSAPGAPTDSLQLRPA